MISPLSITVRMIYEHVWLGFDLDLTVYHCV